MAVKSGDEKWEGEGYNFEQEEEEDEALSLCDLPVNLSNEETKARNEETQALIKSEDFDFSSWGGSVLTESEMCAADDVFFQGQILPLRLSVSSETGLAKFQRDRHNQNGQYVSRSESLDRRNSLGTFSSFSSRSSSTRSHYSSSSSTTTTTTGTSKSRIRNQFHAHPSPKPQIKLSTTPLGKTGNRGQKSTVWDFFRLGLVRTPEIELQDLKGRSSVSRNSSSNSSNSSSSIKIKNSNIKINSNAQGNMGNHKIRQRLSERRGGLLSGCSCSVGAVKPVPLNIVIIKSGSSSTESDNTKASIEEQLQELKLKQNKNKKQKQDGKQTLSRHRTFEWIKELSHSHASYPDEAVDS